MDKDPVTKNKFVDSYKRKFESGKTDADALKAKNQTMENIMKNLVSAPERMVMVGPVGETSVRPSKVNENKLHGGNGKLAVKEM